MTEKSGVMVGGGVTVEEVSRASDKQAVRMAAVSPIQAAPTLIWRHCNQCCESAGGSETTIGAEIGRLPKNSI